MRIKTPAPMQFGAHYHVLLAEDDPALAAIFEEVLQEELEAQGDTLTLTHAETADEALAKIMHRPTPFDLLVTDHNMPDKRPHAPQTGMELLRTLRALSKPPAISVMLSAHLPEHMASKARAAGARAYFQKTPVQYTAIISEIIKLLKLPKTLY